MKNPTITIEQIGSPIRRHRRQRQTLIGLGLNRIGRIVQVPDTPQTHGMIAKVSHLVRIKQPKPNDIKSLSRMRFEALAGYIRNPGTTLFIEELEWHSTTDERVIGLLVRDRVDHDYGRIILGRDERLRFRAINVETGLATPDIARESLFAQMKKEHAKPDEEFHQGDAPGSPADFFTPVVDQEKLSPTFKVLTTEPRYSPARELIGSMMRFHEDADGNFVEQFQTTAFDARLWELYLFATFTELGYASDPGVAVPDFILSSPFGSFGVEATTVNPGAAFNLPESKKELLAYMENYIPIRLARSLRSKLERAKPYWEVPEMEGKPFLIALQDFHSPGSMRMIISAMTEYAFGVRHSITEGNRQIEWIKEHVWNDLREISGFFHFEKAENVSAIIINPQGTLPKFNRMGYIAEFGDRCVRMVRTGFRCNDANPDNPMPTPFVHRVHETGYAETWVEGMVVLHNPNALIALDPELIPGARHEFLQEDGRIMSIVPDFHPLFSQTAIIAAK